jgi:hypothetical protein
VTVYDIKDADGRVFAFEVDNLTLGRRGACRVLARIPGCRLVRGPKFLSWFRESEFCQYEIEGVTFVVEEPFGDNSRYWIGPSPPRWVSQIAAVRQAFIDRRDISPLVRGAVVALLIAMLFAIVRGLK